MDRPNVDFRLPHYQSTTGEFIYSAFRAIAANSPIIGQIRERPTRHRGPTRNVQQPIVVDHLPMAHEQKLEFPFDVIRRGDAEAYIKIIVDASLQYIAQIEQHFVSVFTEVTNASGNAVDVENAELSFDHLIQAVEGMELGIDEDTGELSLPSLVMHPTMRTRLEALQPTPEQIERFAAIVEEKRRKFEQGKKVRRIGR